jgi:hypothetical protein
MATDTPYIPHHPGDLITAADWNKLQGKIQEDIRNKVEEAIKNLTSVPSSENTHKIDNQTADELTKAILEKARQELPLRTGYMRVFRRARLAEEIVIQHGLGAYPVVDIYQLDQFPVICSEDEEKKKEDTMLFYLYHSSEKRLRATIGGAPQVADIETPSRKPFRVPFSEMLSLYKVSYTDTSTLDDLETEFWQEFMKEPNEEFEDDSYCHSPWFDRCCGDKRTVAELKQRGDWDELWFKVKPRKTVIYISQAANDVPIFSLPAPLQVAQFDLNMIGIRYPPENVESQILTRNGTPVEELPLMIILKV